MKRLRLAALAATVVLLLLTLVACGGGSGDRDASPAAVGAVTMKDNKFQPPHIEVPARTTVTWTNGDQVPHDVSIDDGPESEVLQFGATFQHVFDTPGVFDYECTIHPGMVGRVTVVER
jgi:plastocyanin